jgi:hypothetical protein
MKHTRPIFLIASIIFFSACNPFNTPNMKQGFVQISKIQINQLVMHIEFYKLQYGHYPDSLPQLQETDGLVPVTDAAAGTKFVYYNYEKIGDKYALFSSGTDGIPGTKDDFYPAISIPDSSKIGLIIKPVSN